MSKEDLIISKLYWAKDSHSEQQLRDVKNLAATGCANLTTQQSASHCNHRKKCAKIPPPVIRKEIAKA